MENPQSFVALPGNITLYNHDSLHVILDQDLSASGKAAVVGFCMGNEPKTNIVHVLIIKMFSCHFYPKKFRFSAREWIDFKAGFSYGRSRKVKRINQINFRKVKQDFLIGQIRERLGICPQDLNLMKSEFQSQSLKQKQKKAEVFKWSSSFFGIVGGVMVASNTEATPFGFLFLAMSSFQFLIACLIIQDKSFIFLAASTFIFVDLLGIYRWLLSN